MLTEKIGGGVTLINRPDKWTANTEYSFGDGLYGYRAVGTITVAANTHTQIGINLGIKKIVDCGGYWEDDQGYVFPPNMKDEYGTLSYTFAYSNGVFYFWSLRHSVSRTDAPYDIWCLYTK